jgi:hypothetical protein
MLTVSQIRENLLTLLASNDPEALDAFDDWFASASWNMHQNADLVAQKFASAIELRLAEYDSDKLDEAELRRHLSELVRFYSLYLSSEPATIVTGSSSAFSPQQWAISPAGRKPVTA